MREVKQYSAENLEKAYAILGESKKTQTTYYVTLGQTDGSKDVMFVLYVFNKQSVGIGVHNPYRFLKILSNDLLTACKKAKEISGGSDVVIDYESNKYIATYVPSIIPFGKYKGQNINEILEKDAKYIMWLAANYTGKGVKLKNELITAKADAESMITKSNEKREGNSFVGSIGKPIDFKGEVTYIKYYDAYGTVHITTKLDKGTTGTVIFKDADGNSFRKQGVFKDALSIGDNTKFSALIKYHNEYLGNKTNVFGGRISKWELISK
jgi:uncharacterized protein (DUF3820 family)